MISQGLNSSILQMTESWSWIILHYWKDKRSGEIGDILFDGMTILSNP